MTTPDHDHDHDHDRLKVAVAQIDVDSGDVDANLARHRRVIAEARAAGVELLVFPELSLSGYDLGARTYELGMRYDDPRLAALAAEARDMDVIVGFVEEAFAAQVFNSAALLRDGEVHFLHRKLHLATYGQMEEGKYFAAGRYVETCATRSRFNASILLCSDMWNPALVHLAALHGATLLIAPTNSSLDEISGDVSKPGTWDTVLRFYATLYGMPVLFANRIGREGHFRFWGGSRILDACGEELARATDAEALLITTLDYGDVRRARSRLPTVRDSNLALIHREVDRLYLRVGIPGMMRDS
jgi:predicted amidohydrolase